MLLDKATVRRIAHLARIEVAAADLEAVAGQLSGILDWIKQLKEVDTSNVAPMTGGTDLSLRWREDAVTDGGVADKVLASAPDGHAPFFAVPKVIE